MPRKETILKVPNARVPTVEAQYKAVGATVVATPNADGQTTKVVATFANQPRQEVIHDVPNADVARVKMEYEAVNATVTVTPNADGKTSTVTANFP